MLRGLLSGISLGALVSAGALVGLSLLAPQPAGNAPPQAPRVEAPSPADPSPLSEAAPVPEGGVMVEAPSLGTAGGVAVPTGENAPPLVETEAAPLPETAEVAAAPTAPATSPTPEVAANLEEPVLPSPQTTAPASPDSEADLSIEPAPAEGLAEGVVIIDVPPADPAPAAQPQTTQSAPAEQAEPLVDLATPDLPSPEIATPGAPVATAEVPLAPVVSSPEIGAPRAEGSPTADTASAAAVTAADPLPQGLAGPALPQPAAPLPSGEAALSLPDLAPDLSLDGTEPDTMPEAGGPAAPPTGPAPRIGFGGQSASQLPTGDGSILIRRPGDATAEPASPVPAEPETAEARRPLERFAAEFERPDGVPLVSIVLLDDGSLPGGPDILAASAMPVSVAIMAGSKGAEDRMRAYRAKGIEVAAALDLPRGAQPTDVATAIEVARTSLDQTVAYLGLGDTSGRGVAAALLSAAGEEGKGYAGFVSGLGGFERLAEAETVPAVEIYKDIDAKGEDAQAIRRAIDQAAFRARQSGRLVLFARLRPDTISALNIWAAANRSDTLLPAPLSAVLLSTGK